MLLAQARRFVLDGRVRSAGVTRLLEGRVGGTACPVGGSYFSRLRAITMRWTWLVPS